MYREVIMAVICHDQDRRRLLTTFTIWRNKLRANALEHEKGDKFQFTITLLPCSLLRLTHLVCLVGIHFKALKAGYRNIDDLLHQPNLDDVDYLPLKWGDEILDEEIFSMSYTTFGASYVVFFSWLASPC